MTRFDISFRGFGPSIQFPILQNRDILEVYLDGIGMSKILTTGTPVGQEVVYDATLGKIRFPMTPEQGTKIVILYQDL